MKEYTDEELEIIMGFLNVLYHVESNSEAMEFTAVLRSKTNDISKCKNGYMYEFHKLSYLMEKENLRKVLNRLGKYNVEVSLNLFYGKSYYMKNLVSVNAIEFSIDYQNNSRFAYEKPETVIDYLVENVFRCNPIDISETDIKFAKNYIPTPNMIQISNRIRLIYLLDRCRVPKNKKSRNLKRYIKAIKVKMENVLQMHCKVCYKQNLNGFIAIPFTIKRKYIYFAKQHLEFSNEFLLEYSEPYVLQDIADKYYQREQIGNTKRRLNTNKKNVIEKGTPKIHNIKEYNECRVKDIKKLFKLKKKGVGNITYKEICFQIAVHRKLLGFEYNEILREIIKLMPKDESISVEEIKKYISGVRDNDYKFYPDDLAARFGLTRQECEENGLNTFILTRGSKKNRKEYNKYYYNTYRKTSEKEVVHLSEEDKRNIIMDYRKNKLSVVELAKKYKVSKTSIYTVLCREFENKKQLDKKQLDFALGLFDAGYSIKRIAEMMGEGGADYETFRKKFYRYRKRNTP